MGGAGLDMGLVAYEWPFYDNPKWVGNGFLGHAFYHSPIVNTYQYQGLCEVAG